MRYEDLKTHIAEVERCQKHTQTKSVPPVLFPENLWENEKLQLKPGDRQRGHLHQFHHDLQQPAIPELHPDSRTLLAHIHKKFFSGAHGG